MIEVYNIVRIFTLIHNYTRGYNSVTLISAAVIFVACFPWRVQLSDLYRRTGRNKDLNNLLLNFL